MTSEIRTEKPYPLLDLEIEINSFNSVADILHISSIFDWGFVLATTITTKSVYAKTTISAN